MREGQQEHRLGACPRGVVQRPEYVPACRDPPQIPKDKEIYDFVHWKAAGQGPVARTAGWPSRPAGHAGGAAKGRPEARNWSRPRGRLPLARAASAVLEAVSWGLGPQETPT